MGRIPLFCCAQAPDSVDKRMDSLEADVEPHAHLGRNEFIAAASRRDNARVTQGGNDFRDVE